MSETAERANDCSNDQVVTKLRTCGDIVNAALQLAASMCVEGAKIATVCDAADALITEKCGAIYNKPKGIDKGIAFPTCVSVNQIVCHYSPLSSVDGAPLKAGDVVKIDCGAQVDGHASLGAHTVVVAGGAEKLTGDAANCVAAAYTAAALAARMLKVGNTNAQVTAMFAQVAADFGVSTVAGVLSHKMEQHRLDTTTSIIGQEDQDTHVEEYEFEANDVFAVDCVFTTGDGKPKEEADARTTVYKRVPDAKYLLKLKAARAVYSDVR
jgi:curved DNA binding protein